MNLKWITPTSPFNLSYLRRLYIVGLFVMLPFVNAAIFVDAADWKMFLFGALMVTSFLGFLTRVSMFALIVLCVDLLKLPPFTNSLADFYLDLGLILAASRCADVLSADGIFQSCGRADKGAMTAPHASVVYACPIRLIWLFCAAGLLLSGPSHLVVKFVFIGIFLISLVDWTKRIRRWGRKIFLKPVYVIYDGNCKLCRRTAAFLNSIDEIDRLTYVNGLNEAELKRYSLTYLDKTRLAQDMHVISGGKTFIGFFGYREMIKRIPILWLTLPFLYLWPFPQIAQKVYRKIADSRGCSVVTKTKSLQWIDPPLKLIDLIAPAVVAVLLMIGHVIKL